MREVNRSRARKWQFVLYLSLVCTLVVAFGLTLVRTHSTKAAAPTGTIKLGRYYLPAYPTADNKELIGDFHYEGPTSPAPPEGYHSEDDPDGLGYIYSPSTPNIDQLNVKPLYVCELNGSVPWGQLTIQENSFFLSSDASCEGHGGYRDPTFDSGPIGYISQTDGGSTTQPLYRCLRSNVDNLVDHFNTHDGGCEGAGSSEGMMGYTFNAV